jgi:hypothetical protein
MFCAEKLIDELDIRNSRFNPTELLFGFMNDIIATELCKHIDTPVL